MHTPGPWRAVRVECGAYYTHQIEITEGHIASIVGWSCYGTVCATTQANARLIEQAPDMAQALARLLLWANQTGEWDAPCWREAETVLARATGVDAPAEEP